MMHGEYLRRLYRFSEDRAMLGWCGLSSLLLMGLKIAQSKFNIFTLTRTCGLGLDARVFPFLFG